MEEDSLHRQQLRQTYDKYAQERDSRDIETWKIAERDKVLMTFMQAGKNKLLEIGAGTGRDSKFFVDKGFDVVCIDLSPAMVKLCQQKGLTAYVMDMGHISFQDESFDAIYSMNSLLHLTKSEFPHILDQILALLRNDGIFYLGTYGGYDHEGEWDKDPYTPKRFFSFFSDEHIQQEVSKRFDILLFEKINFSSESPVHFQSLLLKT
jgi:cyclopropane fatty-acyl-phospholipid synthase-like methyltransferase